MPTNTSSTFAASRWNICNIHMKRMKYAVATCAHLLAAIQWWLVDAARGERNARHGWRVTRGMGRVCSTRRVQRETWGAGAHGARRVCLGGIGRNGWIGKRSSQIFLIKWRSHEGSWTGQTWSTGPAKARVCLNGHSVESITVNYVAD